MPNCKVHPAAEGGPIEVPEVASIVLLFFFKFRARKVDCALTTTSASCWPKAFTPRPMITTPFQRECIMLGRQTTPRGHTVRRALEAKNRRIPLPKPKYGPACHEPNECFTEAGTARDATLQVGAVLANEAPAATALPSAAHARLEAPPLEVLNAYMGDDAI